VILKEKKKGSHMGRTKPIRVNKEWIDVRTIHLIRQKVLKHIEQDLQRSSRMPKGGAQREEAWEAYESGTDGGVAGTLIFWHLGCFGDIEEWFQ
jgi:hypothetical protein